MTHITCMLTAKKRDQLRNPTLNSRVWASFTFLTVVYVSFYCQFVRSFRQYSVAPRNVTDCYPCSEHGVTSNTPAPAQISKSNLPSPFPFRSLPPPYRPSFPFFSSPTHPSLLHHVLPFPASISLLPTHSYPVLPSHPLYSGRGSARGAL